MNTEQIKMLDDTELQNMFELYADLQSRSVKDDLILDFISNELSARGL
jgi:hypothetical protein